MAVSLAEKKGAVSFTGFYFDNGYHGKRPATLGEITEYWGELQQQSRDSVSAFERNVSSTLARLKNTADYQTFQFFFSSVRVEQQKYENEKFANLIVLMNDPNYDVVLTRGKNNRLEADQRLGDNCYEFATKDFYERTLSKHYRVTNVSLENGATVGVFTGYEHPYFLQPGFTYGWQDRTKPPLFSVNYNSWEQYSPFNTGHVAELCNNVKKAVLNDAKVFGLSCKYYESFDSKTYVVKPNTTLIFGIIGLTRNGGLDHHWYRFYPNNRLWVHKPGMTPVTCFDASGKLIDNPSECEYSYADAAPIGFFELSPL